MKTSPALPTTRPTTPSTFEINRVVMGRTIVLTLLGKPETACIDDLEDQLARASTMRPQHVLLNLRQLGGVTDLISATISAFANTIRHNGGSVRYIMQPMRRSA